MLETQIKWTRVFERVVLAWFIFRSQTEMLLKRPKKTSHFGQNVRNYKLKNTVTASLNTTVGEMTEMAQRKKSRY